ncbi:MAG: hypothetical protein WC091_04560 [Sulfuricellaceae bacterium]
MIRLIATATDAAENVIARAANDHSAAAPEAIAKREMSAVRIAIAVDDDV